MKGLIALGLCLSMTALAAAEGWQAKEDLVNQLSERRPAVNYREENVPAYTLPDPLVTKDGKKVTSADMWREQRRPEILELFRSQVYGRAPEKPAGVWYQVTESSDNALGGLATRLQVALHLDKKGEGPALNLLLYTPRAANGPSPVFVGLNFNGNHTVNADPAIHIPDAWMRSTDDHKAHEEDRGSAASRWATEMILKRGYGLATMYYGDIDPDFDDGFENGVQGAFDPEFKGERPADAWGSIAAWAWGLSRIADYLRMVPTVDKNGLIVLGHSRLGKTSLWAGAQDERFAIVISNDSGCGGAALSRRAAGETVAQINQSFPHWFCGNFKQYGGNEAALPVDQHMLLALVAPRPVYVASADEDLWADPRGEFLSALNADPVYRLLGTGGLGVKEMPGLSQPVRTTIGHHIRPGGHDVKEYDWEQYLTFADIHLKRK